MKGPHHVVHLFMEYAEHGDLLDYMSTKPNGRLDSEEAMRVFRQILDAVEYCHGKNIAHRGKYLYA